MTVPARMLEGLARLIPKSRAMRALGIAVAAGAAVGVLLVPTLPAPGDDAERLPEVTLLGEKLAPGEGAIKRALERVRRYSAGRFRLDISGQPARELYLGTLG